MDKTWVIRFEVVFVKCPVSSRSSGAGKGKRSVHGPGHEADPGTVDSGLLVLLIAMRSPENDITAELIREILLDQHPDLAEYPLRLGARGWDNQLWRLGDHFAVRLPWATQFAGALLRKEHTWLPVLAPRLPLRVP